MPDSFAVEEAVKDAGWRVRLRVGLSALETVNRIAVREAQATLEKPPNIGDVIAGFYVLELPDMTAAMSAERIPTARYGKVEGRPVVAF